MKKKLLVPFVLSLILPALAASAAETASDSDVPVAPIPPTAFEGWTNAFVLQNPLLEVVVVPEIGRIARISFQGGKNLLRLDQGLAGKGPDPQAPENWMNFGGDWVWPVIQSRWTLMAKSDWPPPPALADRPWQGTAWKSAAGNPCCLIGREYGPPLNIKLSRHIRLSESTPKITIRQRIERTADSDIPVVLWNISQVGSARRVVLPADSSSPLAGGFKTLMFAPPEESNLTTCAGTLVYHASIGGEHKLCSDSARAWIAVEKSGILLLERTTPGSAGGEYPDGGCTVEMYSNTGLGYSEIETLSVEKDLEAGEVLQNTLTIECFPKPTNAAAPCDLAEEVRKRVGE